MHVFVMRGGFFISSSTGVDSCKAIVTSPECRTLIQLAYGPPPSFLGKGGILSSDAFITASGYKGMSSGAAWLYVLATARGSRSFNSILFIILAS